MRTRAAVVCGAAGDIGAAVFRRFEREGWGVVGIDRRSKRNVAIEADLSAPLGAAAILDAIGSGANVETVVNCVGEQLVKPVWDTTFEDWDRVFSANARVAFSVTKLGVELLGARQPGSIVHVASIHSQASSPGMAAYAASKGAVVSLARAAAVELAARGIRVNVVSPGAVDTSMLRRGIAERASVTGAGGMERLVVGTPLARLADPDEVAAAVEFLSDHERSGFITGQVLVVDGGVTALLASE
jgi:glucose 1-dehydrogenase